MESKNILLVIIAVCALFVVVFVVGLWFSLPKSNRNQNLENLPYQIVEYGVSSPTPIKPMTTESPEELQQSSEESQNITQNEDSKLKKVNLFESTDRNSSSSLATKKTKKRENELPTTWIATPVITPKPVKTPSRTYKSRKITKTIEFWIQAGSFSKKSNAKTRSDIIKEHGFSPQIQTREIKNITQYRVRIGPYNEKAEAEKFLNWLKVLDGLSESYISQVTRTKSL